MNPEDELRRAFEAEAGRVEVAPDALPTIRSRIRSRRSRRLRGYLAMGLGSLATASVATVTAVVVGLGSCTPPTATHTPPPGGSSTAPTGPTTTPPHSGVDVALPVYYVGEASGRPVLYREFRTKTLSMDTVDRRVGESLGLAMDGPALDPDYTTPWPDRVTIGDIQIAGDAVVLDLRGTSGAGPSGAMAKAAVQQLVWTVTAASGKTGLRLRLDGKSAGTLWGVPVSGTLTRAPALDTLAPLWLISPQQGQTVGRSFEAHVAGIVFEAMCRLRVRDAGGATVSDQMVTLSGGAPAQGEARVRLNLTPGRYTVEVYYISARDGSEQGLDDHEILVS